MEEWFVCISNIIKHIDNEEDPVLRARARAFYRAAPESIKLIKGWLACDQAHTKYTGL